MYYHPDDTIAAIGTAAGGAARGMVRLSGPQILDCLGRCFEPADRALRWSDIREPSIVVGSIAVAGQDSGKLPCDLFLWPSRRSYTRQPTAELHTLGSPPLLEQILRRVCECGARLAQPGEFTLRAFLAGRLDLTQAEAVLGVIDARSSSDLSAALAQLAGGLSQPLGSLREKLLQLLAELEAGLDFAEEDIEFISAEQLRQQLTAAQEIVSAIVQQISSRGDSTDLPRIVLSGAPNAGKSSLFNALVKRYAADPAGQYALVSEQAGTTRDFIAAVLDLSGLACELVDTAGVESNATRSAIDQIAQRMTRQQHSQASLIVHCHDATCSAIGPVEDSTKLIAWTKTDLLSQAPPGPAAQIACSSVSGDGLEALARRIHDQLTRTAHETRHTPCHTATRCTESLGQAETALRRAAELAAVRGGEELIAAEVRTALQSLGQVVGTVYTDDILDRIFGQFCIGK